MERAGPEPHTRPLTQQGSGPFLTFVPARPGLAKTLARDLRIDVTVVAFASHDEAAVKLGGQGRVVAAKWARSGWPEANEMVLWSETRPACRANRSVARDSVVRRPI